MSLPRYEQVRNLKKEYSKTDLALMCVQLLDQVDETGERLDETRAAVDAAENACQRVGAENDKLYNELAHAQSNIAKLDETNKEQANRVSELREELYVAETEVQSLQARMHWYKPGDQYTVLITTSGSGVLRASGFEYVNGQEIQIWERVATSYNRYEAAEMALALNNQYKREND